MEYREPQKLDLARVDFSELHALDHHIWESYCKTLPGGRRRHVSLAWRFRWERGMRAATVCRFGIHRSAQTWRCDPPGTPAATSLMCIDCGKPLSAEQPR